MQDLSVTTLHLIPQIFPGQLANLLSYVCMYVSIYLCHVLDYVLLRQASSEIITLRYQYISFKETTTYVAAPLQKPTPPLERSRQFR